MAKIESFRFGKIVIDREEYKSDVIIFPGRVHSPWWRREGHKVYLEDLQELEGYNPEIVIFGTGTFGLVKVTEPVLGHLESKGVEVVVKKTGAACELFNQYYGDKNIIACLHLTC